MESALSDVYALVVFISEISLVCCTHSFNFWYINNSCVNTIRPHFPWSVLYVLHCYQSCVYSDETTWCPQWKIRHENLWKHDFRDSKFQNVPRCLGPNKLVPLIWCKFQSCLLFIISLLLKNLLTALTNEWSFG